MTVDHSGVILKLLATSAMTVVRSLIIPKFHFPFTTKHHARSGIAVRSSVVLFPFDPPDWTWTCGCILHALLHRLESGVHHDMAWIM
jgi:hypothetical protein